MLTPRDMDFERGKWTTPTKPGRPMPNKAGSLLFYSLFEQAQMKAVEQDRRHEAKKQIPETSGINMWGFAEVSAIFSRCFVSTVLFYVIQIYIVVTEYKW